MAQTSSMLSTQSSPQAALEIRDLAKRFDRPAVDGLSLQVRAGEFYTLLGPNGAGKTTTLRMATGLLKPDRGAISVFGIDLLAEPVGAKQIMAWLSDEPIDLLADGEEVPGGHLALRHRRAVLEAEEAGR